MRVIVPACPARSPRVAYALVAQGARDSTDQRALDEVPARGADRHGEREDDREPDERLQQRVVDSMPRREQRA